MTKRSKRLDVRLSEDQWKILTAAAEAQSKPKAVIMKQLAFDDKPHSLPSGPNVYADALEAAARSYSGIPRVAMAGIVSAVIKSLATH